MEGNPQLLVVQVSAPSSEAEGLARHLVEARLIACASLVPSVRSIYHWQGQVEAAEETLLILKTTEAAFPALEAELRRRHSYQVPEILGWTVTHASAPYADWVKTEVRLPA